MCHWGCNGPALKSGRGLIAKPKSHLLDLVHMTTSSYCEKKEKLSVRLGLVPLLPEFFLYAVNTVTMESPEIHTAHLKGYRNT